MKMTWWVGGGGVALMLYIGLLYPISACLPLAQALQSVYTDGTVDFGCACCFSCVRNQKLWQDVVFPICGPWRSSGDGPLVCGPRGQSWNSLWKSKSPFRYFLHAVVHTPRNAPLTWRGWTDPNALLYFNAVHRPGHLAPCENKKRQKKGPLLKKFPSSEAAFVVFFWLKLFCNHLFPLM